MQTSEPVDAGYAIIDYPGLLSKGPKGFPKRPSCHVRLSLRQHFSADRGLGHQILSLQHVGLVTYAIMHWMIELHV